MLSNWSISKPSKPYNVDIEGLLMSLSGVCIFWKDINGCYLGANDYTAEIAQLSSCSAILGMNDYSLGWKDQAVAYRKNDDLAIKNGAAKHFYELMSLPNREPTSLLTIKSPLYDNELNVQGALGISFPLAKSAISENLQAINDAGIRLTKNQFLNSNEQYIVHRAQVFNLTKRQTECLYYLVRGKTAKQIAKALNISYRTVEDYLDHLKLKLKCENRSDLICKAIEMGFGSI